ncbi:helix-turn-helix transcriptional regulator [Yoonia sp.]|uniref:helix-turn-helix transcriptional regulator n=1 Tax=Yoonia sp. TaxID=2212373 RepID=UPI0019F2AA60|nr:helix-turn-helix transcriptional regulator [Yoonia sp.]MBE0413733.1 helix-turn-helix transcriptional regulator [Yoonia sp.]
MMCEKVVNTTRKKPSGALRIADFLTRWTECLHGAGDLRDSLALFADLTGARLVTLARFDPKTGRQRIITCFDLDAQAGKRPLIKAMAPFILNGHGIYARPGTVWTLSEKDSEPHSHMDARSQRWMTDRGFEEVVVIPLGRHDTEVDAIEFYRSNPVTCADDPTFQWLATSVADVWGRRRKGRIARLLRSVPAISNQLGQPDLTAPDDPLSSENPFQLTAAESRICMLIQAGLTFKQISAETGVAESTMRSHLRSIYAKTGAAGQVGLMRMLMHVDQTAQDAVGRRA